MLTYKCKNCGHLLEDHYNGWAECLECNCVMFEFGSMVEIEEDTLDEIEKELENE